MFSSRLMERHCGLLAFRLMAFPPHEYQVCLWCAQSLHDCTWACQSCRRNIRESLHTMEVYVYNISGQCIFVDCPHFQGSLALRDLRVMLCLGLFAIADSFIKVIPSSVWPILLPHPIPEDYPIGLLGNRINAIFLRDGAGTITVCDAS